MNIDKKVYKDLFKIVMPIAFQYLMASLVTASDAFMLGFLEQTSLSACSLAGQVAFVYSLFFFSFTYGCSVLAAQYWGKGDKESVNKVFSITMRYCLLVGAIFSIATLLFPEKIMYIFTSDPNVVKAGGLYLRAVSLSYILTGFSQAYYGILKVAEMPVISSAIGSTSVVINIILNAVLIFGLGPFPRLEIEGAALATVIARLFECTVLLIMILFKKIMPFSIRHLFGIGEDKSFKTLHKDYWFYTFPLLLNQIGWGGGVTMYSVIMGHLGDDATAANSIASIVRSIIASFCWGVSSGVGVIIGNMLGRNDLEGARKAGGSFTRFSIAIGIISGLVILAITPLVLTVIKPSLTVTAFHYLRYMMLMAAYYIIGNSLNSTVIAGIFPAGGDTKFGMICDIITLWAFVVPLGLLAAFVFKVPVLVVAFILTLDEFVKIPAVYIHYKKYTWVKNITR